MLRRPLVALLIGLFAAIVVAGAGYFLLVSKKNSEVSKKQKAIEDAQSQITQQKNTYKQLTDIKNRSAEFEAKLATLQAKIPELPELPSLIRNIQAAADVKTGAGLPWLSFTPADIAAEASASYSSYEFTMLVAGFYDEVVDLIYRLERMERAIVIKGVTMTPTTGILGLTYSPNLGLVQVTINAKTFTFSGTETGAGTAPAGPQTTPSTAPSTAPTE